MPRAAIITTPKRKHCDFIIKVRSRTERADKHTRVVLTRPASTRPVAVCFMHLGLMEFGFVIHHLTFLSSDSIRQHAPQISRFGLSPRLMLHHPIDSISSFGGMYAISLQLSHVTFFAHSIDCTSVLCAALVICATNLQGSQRCKTSRVAGCTRQRCKQTVACKACNA